MLIQLFCFYFIFVRICQASLKLFSFFKVIVVFQMIFLNVFFFSKEVGGLFRVRLKGKGS